MLILNIPLYDIGALLYLVSYVLVRGDINLLSIILVFYSYISYTIFYFRVNRHPFFSLL